MIDLYNPYFLWVLVVVCTAILVCLIVFFIDGNENLKAIFLVAAAIAALGATAGLIGGLSRLAVAGHIVPAVLSLVGGVTLYIFFIHRDKGVIVSLLTLAFVSAFFFCYLGGSSIRSLSDRFYFWREHCVEIYSNPKIEAESPLIDFSFGPICGLIFRFEQDQFGI